jgi:hypothetical protein
MKPFCRLSTLTCRHGGRSSQEKGDEHDFAHLVFFAVKGLNGSKYICFGMFEIVRAECYGLSPRVFGECTPAFPLFGQEK